MHTRQIEGFVLGSISASTMNNVPIAPLIKVLVIYSTILLRKAHQDQSILQWLKTQLN